MSEAPETITLSTGTVLVRTTLFEDGSAEYERSVPYLGDIVLHTSPSGNTMAGIGSVAISNESFESAKGWLAASIEAVLRALGQDPRR